jgi:hypothetical protein
MTSPRTLFFAIGATAIAFALALGSVLSSATLDSAATDSPVTRPNRVALAAAPMARPNPAK